MLQKLFILSMKNYILQISFGFVFFVNLGAALAQSVEPELSRKLSEYVQDKNADLASKAKISILVERVPDGAPVFSQREDELLHMASVQKLLISYVALKNLGGEHQFLTEVYVEEEVDAGKSGGGSFSSIPEVSFNKPSVSSVAKDLFVRPYGNPLMQFEDLLLIARELRNRGITQVGSLILDTSLFLDPLEVSGPESFSASQTASALEFNSYRVDVFPNSSGEKARIALSPGMIGQVINKTMTLSGKGINLEVSQSPDFASFSGKSFVASGILKTKELKIQVDGKIGTKDVNFTQYLSHPEPDSYFINAFQLALKHFGIRVNGDLRIGRVPKGVRLVYEHKSEPLSDVINRLNHFSNNFIAGQLLYAIGQNENGIFSRLRGKEVLLETLVKLPKFNTGEVLVDASGLSVDNRISPSQILSVLKATYSDFGIFPSFISSLSRFGVSGTLEDRPLISKEEFHAKTFSFLDQLQRAESVWAKTGTVKGVSAISGFLEAQSHQKLGFCISINGDIEKKSAIEIENDIIRILLGIK